MQHNAHIIAWLDHVETEADSDFVAWLLEEEDGVIWF